MNRCRILSSFVLMLLIATVPSLARAADRIIDTAVAGDFKVKAGDTLTVYRGGSITGSVLVNGGTLILDDGALDGALGVRNDGSAKVRNGGKVTGTITIQKGNLVVDDGGNVNGDVEIHQGRARIKGSTNDYSLAAHDADEVTLEDCVFGGDVTVSRTAVVSVVGCVIGGDLTIDGSGMCSAQDNQIAGSNTGCGSCTVTDTTGPVVDVSITREQWSSGPWHHIVMHWDELPLGDLDALTKAFSMGSDVAFGAGAAHVLVFLGSATCDNPLYDASAAAVRNAIAQGLAGLARLQPTPDVYLVNDAPQVLSCAESRKLASEIGATGSTCRESESATSAAWILAIDGNPERLPLYSDQSDVQRVVVSREASKAPFRLAVETVETMENGELGAVVRGRIESGAIQVGETVEIVGLGRETLKSTITGIEMFRKLLDRGEAGDNVGLLLRGIDKKDIRRGMVIARPGTARPASEMVVEISMLKKEEGGRHTPFHNKYRPQFYFRTTDVTGEIELPAGRDMVSPGDTVTTGVQLIVPIAMDKGVRFTLREGGRTVGAGQVIEIIK